jgi:hypothetical protein
LSQIVNYATFGQYGESYIVPAQSVLHHSPWYSTISAEGHGTSSFIPGQWPASLPVEPYMPPLPIENLPRYYP